MPYWGGACHIGEGPRARPAWPVPMAASALVRVQIARRSGWWCGGGGGAAVVRRWWCGGGGGAVVVRWWCGGGDAAVVVRGRGAAGAAAGEGGFGSSLARLRVGDG
eukprot:4233488-Prymnesium_polylepis.1